MIEITKAVIMLHNFLIYCRNYESGTKYFPAGYADEDTAKSVRPGGCTAEEDSLGFIDINQIGSTNYS